MKRMIVGVLFTLVSTNLLAGYSYHFTSVAHGPRGDRTTSGIATVDGAKSRVEFQAGDNLLFPDGAVAISSDDGKDLRVLDTAHKTFYEVKLDDILNPVRIRASMPVDMKVANPKVTVRDEGDGGEIEGYPTHKYTIETSYDMNVNVMDRSITNHVDMHHEVWATEKLPASAMTFVQMRGARTGLEAVDKLLDAQQVKGFRLKQVVTATTTSNMGNGPRIFTTETSVSQIQEKKVAAEQFASPDGYTKVDVPQPQPMMMMRQ